MMYFNYGEKETGHLRKKDKKLGAVIDRCGKLAEISDIANAAVFLASDEAKMVNCHTLCVDGGWTAW